jgi:hypothetical protein
MAKYRKKPVVVEAVRWTGSNLEEIRNFVGSNLIEEWVEFFDIKRTLKEMLVGIAIETLEGTMRVDYGDYIIKGVKGEFYPCKPDIFEQSYEEIDNVETQEEKKTYLSEYLKEHNCSYKEFMEHQEMYDGFCPVGLEEAPCPIELDCMGCWNQEVKGE